MITTDETAWLRCRFHGAETICSENNYPILDSHPSTSYPVIRHQWSIDRLEQNEEHREIN